MQINANVKVPRPTGKWEILKWNLLKGETEADAEVIKQDNLITDAAIKLAMFKLASASGIFGSGYSNTTYTISVSTDATTPYASVADGYSIGNFATSDISLSVPTSGAIRTSTGSCYFFTTGVAGADVGKVINSIRLGALSAGQVFAWLKLASPITLAAGDVIKVNCSFSMTDSASCSGSAALTTFAYGKDPAVPGDGVSAGSFDWTLNFTSVSAQRLFYLPIDGARTVVTNGDGSLSCVETYTYTSAVKPVNGSAGDVPLINLTKSSATLGTLSFTGATKPQWTPGSYYTITVAVTMTVAAA